MPRLKHPRQDPHILRSNISIDAGLSPNTAQRNKKVREILAQVLRDNLTWVQIKENWPLGTTDSARRQFNKLVLKCKNSTQGPSQLVFGRGNRANASRGALAQVAKKALTGNITGHGYGTFDARRELQEMCPEPLTPRQWKTAEKKLRETFRVTPRANDYSTVAQNRENHDIRNPVTHAAGHQAIISLDDGSEIDPALRFNLDMTGLAVKLIYSSGKNLHPMDSTVPSKGVSTKGSTSITNMKLVSTFTQFLLSKYIQFTLVSL
jgi:hypothetical protein